MNASTIHHPEQNKNSSSPQEGLLNSLEIIPGEQENVKVNNADILLGILVQDQRVPFVMGKAVEKEEDEEEEDFDDEDSDDEDDFDSDEELDEENEKDGIEDEDDKVAEEEWEMDEDIDLEETTDEDEEDDFVAE